MLELVNFVFGSGFSLIASIIGVMVFLNFVPVGLWISAIAAGVNVSIIDLIGMRLRRVPAAQIVLPLIKANKAGLDVTVDQLEAHYLAGGNVDRVIDALIAAHRAGIDLNFERGCAIDLAGRNVLEAVQMSVNPEVIETPVVSAVAKDGIELKVKARVTVRANIDKLVGGAGEATIIARVGEGIVTNVGSSADHTAVLENPDYISKTVLETSASPTNKTEMKAAKSDITKTDGIYRLLRLYIHHKTALLLFLFITYQYRIPLIF